MKYNYNINKEAPDIRVKTDVAASSQDLMFSCVSATAHPAWPSRMGVLLFGFF